MSAAGRLGLGAPSGTLFLTVQGSVNTGRRRSRPVPWRANPFGASPLAVSSVDGAVTTFGGTPPFEQGGAIFSLEGEPRGRHRDYDGVCCFSEGTTDGYGTTTPSAVTERDRPARARWPQPLSTASRGNGRNPSRSSNSTHNRSTSG